MFQLNAGNTPGHLNFLSFEGGNTELKIPLATLGNPTSIEFFAGYVADSGFGSNESLPASGAMNSGGNVGFNGTSPGYENHNEFIIVPEPATLGLFTLGGLALLGRGIRRRD